MARAPEDRDLHDTEVWFARRGLPMFIEEYDNGRDVWTRALPALVVTFLLSLLSPVVGISDDGDVRLDVAVPAAAAVLVATAGYAWWNRRRGRRPLALPDKVGWPVLLGYVLVPVLVEVVGTRSWASAGAALVGMLAWLLVIWVVTRYALLALVWWAVRHMFRQLGDVYRLTTRALPLLLLVVTILFLTTEMWQVAGTMPALVLWAALAFFLGLAALFMIGQVRAELRGLEFGLRADDVVEACDRTPMQHCVRDLPGLDERVPLRIWQRLNVGAVFVVSRGVQVFLVALLVWAFFVAFGAIAVSVPVQQAWLGDLDPVDVFVPLFDDHAVTRPLLRTATFLGGFSAFYVTIVGATDPLYREQFFRGITDEVARVVAVRRAYLARRRALGLAAPAGDAGDPGDSGDAG